ncbi:MAG: hypothetical protein WA966_12415 [Ornithinimicrobium sp.]
MPLINVDVVRGQCTERLLAHRLERECGPTADDPVVALTINGAAGWSLGGGCAQLVTGGL